MARIDNPAQMEQVAKTEPGNFPLNLAEVKAIKESRGTLVRERADLAHLVEIPLLSACEMLYDKNIQTTETTANAEDIENGGNVGIIINFDALSPENQDIAQKICEVTPHPDGYTQASIDIPVTQNTSVAEIKERAESVASQFKLQPLAWSPMRTIQEMRILYGLDPEDENYSAASFVGPRSKLYYDDATERFYLSKEHFEKIKAYELSSQPAPN